MDQKHSNAPNVLTSVAIIPFETLHIGDFIGSGGFGEVYKGIWQNRPVAIKQLKEVLSGQLSSEFIRETNIMARCVHPQIVRLFGIIKEVKFYMVMEYMPQGSLYDVLQNKAIDLPWCQRFTMAIDVGNGLSFLHSQKILHLDLKSHNVLLSDKFEAKIGDFGLSKIKFQSSESYSDDPAGGTTRYRAPESFKPGFKPDKSTDIYSYGLVLWEIAARSIPYEGEESPYVVEHWIEQGKQENIPEECSEDYGNIIKKCWLDSGLRPSVAEVVSDLERGKSLLALAVAFKRLFLTPIKIDQEARLKLLGFFSTRDRKSFGCASQDCYAVQKEMDGVSIVNVILYGSELIPGNCRNLIKNYISTERLQVCFHEVPSDAPEKLSKKYFSDMVIAFIIFDANQSSSVKKAPHIATYLRNAADHPLPIVKLSITQKKSDFPLPDIGSISYFEPSSTKPFREVFSNLTRNVGSGALLFHKAIIHQLKTHQLSIPSDYFRMPGTIYLDSDFSIILRIVCVGMTNEKADHLNRYETGTYVLMPPSMGANFNIKKYIFNEVTFVEQLWDTCAQERFRSLTRLYVRGVAAIYSFAPLDNDHDFKIGVNEAFHHQDLLHQNAAILCLGINSDRERVISEAEAYYAAKEKGYDAYFECSARTGDGIDDAFKSSFELAVAKNGFWKWLGKPYTPSAKLKKGLILEEEKLLNLGEQINEAEIFGSQKENAQTIIFKRLFFASIPINQEARLKLFGFFSTRDRKSLGCASQDCYASQKEMDGVYEKNFRG